MEVVTQFDEPDSLSSCKFEGAHIRLRIPVLTSTHRIHRNINSTLLLPHSPSRSHAHMEHATEMKEVDSSQVYRHGRMRTQVATHAKTISPSHVPSTHLQHMPNAHVSYALRHSTLSGRLSQPLIPFHLAPSLTRGYPPFAHTLASTDIRMGKTQHVTHQLSRIHIPSMHADIVHSVYGHATILFRITVKHMGA